MQGRLLTEDFLREGIRATAVWSSLAPSDSERFETRLRHIFTGFLQQDDPNEDVTEDDLIYPVLEALGWPARLVKQKAAKRRTDIPDCLLFSDTAAKAAALAESEEHRRYRHGACFVEAKRWNRPLDRGTATDRLDPEVPSNQMLRYLSQVEVASEQRLLWGFLTNGRNWRLYYQRSLNRAEEYLEFDLGDLLQLPGCEDLFDSEAGERAQLLKCFLVFFRPEAFRPDAAFDGHSFLEFARRETRLWEERVAKDLSQVVFREVFPLVALGFLANDPQRPQALDDLYLDEIRNAALVLLYRLLFVLHAEDRDLLPVRDARYDGYSLRRLRQEISVRRDAHESFSVRLFRDYERLRALFRAVGEGDDALGLPPYNGGLFSDAQHATLARLRLPDASLCEVVDALSRTPGGRWINYRDLSVQQLGSIYERLLEYRVVAPDRKTPRIEQGIYARRVSGSFYTDETLVQLVLRRTIGPLIEERRVAFARKLEELRTGGKRVADRLKALEALDPASRLLDLRVCDPAMGSGHFLVSLVDYLADQALELVSEAAVLGSAVARGTVYRSPLLQRTAEIRRRLLDEARKHRWPVQEEQLDDRHLVRRIILKRVIYGVDLNPMAVELAKLSLWLHSFTAGAPLSFLDHHLRCGNSLVGSRVDRVRHWIETGLFGSSFAGMLLATDMMHRLEEITDSDIGEVKASTRAFEEIERSLGPYRELLHLDAAHDWLYPEDRRERARWLDPHTILSGAYGRPLDAIQRPDQLEPGARATLSGALGAAEKEGFFHWELMFPEVWYEKGRERIAGGFDAVIGNPPWDRIKLQEVEFFAERRLEIAQAQTAAARKQQIAALEKIHDPLWSDYVRARDHAERLAAYVRRCNQYPQLSGGDTNLYALFAERAMSLVHPHGLMGFLVPSGIASDKEKAEFFGDLATQGRIVALLDFENRLGLFPDVDQRFKFCVFTASGPERSFLVADCAFFLHSTHDLRDPARTFQLTPEDFSRVNPNTKTAPVFRSRRDAEITKRIYERLGVLVDRRQSPPANPWRVSYFTMFHMTNDSEVFRTKEQLRSEGFYPSSDNRWKKGAVEYLPLYEGKMVQIYDHRAASVVVNPKNVHRPGQPLAATEEQHRNPNWLSAPQFWVPEKAISEAIEGKIHRDCRWYLAFKEITSPTNARTIIGAFLPAVGTNNKLPLLLAECAADMGLLPLLAACLNSFALDYVLRQKLAGQTINLFILEQLPFPLPSVFSAPVARGTLADFVRDRVLRLTYTAHDLAGFSNDSGYEGPPFAWDGEQRRHLMAELDAVMFRLYGIDLDEADYVLSNFPIVRHEDETAFGYFRTRDLILAYMRAHLAGDYSSKVAV
jgi:hypothetical protein